MPKEIEAFVVKNPAPPDEESLSVRGVSATTFKDEQYRPCAVALKEQSEYLGVDMLIHVVGMDQLPKKASSRVVMILNENILLPESFLLNLVSLNNIYKSEAALFGPISTHISVGSVDWLISDISKHYKSYSINDFSKNLCFEITGEEHNYPPAYAISLPAQAYNLAGGLVPLKTPRATFLDNPIFLNRVSDKAKMIYSTSLNTKYFIHPSELNIKNFSQYFYMLGYRQGAAFAASTDKSYEKVWEQFVTSADPTDNRVLNCLSLREDLSEEQLKVYSEKLASFKCVYGLGLLEGLQGERII